jgi:hypothetical protein
MTDSPAPSSPPAPRLPRRLLALNIALLLTLVLISVGTLPAPSGAAQPTGRSNRDADRQARQRGEYALIAGRVQGAQVSGVYVLDSANRDLVALVWSRTRSRFEPVGYRSLVEDTRIFREGR